MDTNGIVEKILCLQDGNNLQFLVNTEYVDSTADVWNINGYYLLFEFPEHDEAPVFRGAYKVSTGIKAVRKIIDNYKQWGLE